jgi:hypothetical protein
MITLDNSLYDNTLLEGIPFKFRYQETKPESIYKVSASGAITLHNYRDWINIPENPSLKKIRNLFLHDTCHLILYFLRGDHQRIFKSDFGLNWDYITYVSDNHNWFFNKNERTDEYRIVAIHKIIRASIQKTRTPTFKEMKQLVYRDMDYMWHVKKITPKARKEKRKEIAEACDYICNQIGAKKIRETAKELVEYLQETVTFH